MTFDELYSKAISLFPNALIEEDEQTGEIVIWTGWVSASHDLSELRPVDEQA